MKNNLDDAFNITPTEVEVDPVEVKEPVGIQKPDRLTKMILKRTMSILVVISTAS